MIATTADELRRLVDEYLQFDTFVFDLETYHRPSQADQGRYNVIRNDTSPKDRRPDDDAWMKAFDMRATDYRVNEVIWFGLATYGRSDSVATGHPHGAMLKPVRRENVLVADLYPPGDRRRLTKRDAVSKASVMRTLAAEFEPPPPQLDIQQACKILEPLMVSESIRKVNQNIGFDCKTLSKYRDGRLPLPPWGELSIALHIIDENRFPEGGWNLENFVKVKLGHSYNKLGSKGVHNFGFLEAAKYAEQDARFTWLLWKEAEYVLQQNPELWELFEFEMRVAATLREQEMNGIKVDRKAMADLRSLYEQQIVEINDRLIYDHGAPEGFNTNSTADKGVLLFERTYETSYGLGTIVPPILTDTGKASVKKAALESVKDGLFSLKVPNPDYDSTSDKRMAKKMVVPASELGGAADEARSIAKLYLEHVEKQKAIGTFFIGIGAKLSEDDYAHPNYGQHTARTGRLSCYAPNLQQISRVSDIKGMFVPDEGEKLLYADYDQIELRFLCFMSQDTAMRDLFLSDTDIHTATAALVTGKSVEEIDGETRTTHGKVPNFLVTYGGEAFRLHVQTGISEKEAQKVITSYFKRFPQVKPWKDRVIRDAKSAAVYKTINGSRRMVVPPYVETMLGRRRRLPDLMHNPDMARGDRDEWKRLNKLKTSAERQAINAVVSGSAAESLKQAMIDITNYIHETGFPMRLVLNVHDEIVAVTPVKYAELGLDILTSKMEAVVNYKTGKAPLEGWVPLVASGKMGDRWSK